MDFFDGDRSDDEGIDEDDVEDDIGPHWIAAQLDWTTKKNEEEMQDTRACRGKVCQLCANLTSTDPQCSSYIKNILDIEKRNSNKMNSTIMYEVIVQRYNESVFRRTEELIGTSEIQKRGICKLTVPMVRRHYEQNHVKDPIRALWNLIHYDMEALEELRQSGLWMINIKDTGSGKQPNAGNFMIQNRLVTQIRHNLAAVAKLIAELSPS